MLFNGFLTINLAEGEDPDDAIRHWRKFVEDLCGIKPDYYAVFVALKHKDVRINPHLHILIKCQPGTAIFDACARYSSNREKRYAVAGGRPVNFEQTDPKRGGTLGLLAYMHGEYNATEARLGRGEARVHRSQHVAGLGRALPSDQINNLRSILAAARPGQNNDHLISNNVQPRKLYSTTYINKPLP